ncbi:MAG: ATP:cob(I)alamin adenosyltransferase [bacterium]|nr:ATP:cob(I)alamin adenosyltransferase [bacterium]
MDKIYTKKGDRGFTADYSGRRIPKDHILVITGGKIDTLQSAIDLAILKSAKKHKLFLGWIQRKLWQTAGEISCADETCIIDPITAEDINRLEKYIDSLGKPPQKFIRFDTEKAIIYNEARIRCRELETFLVKLLRAKKVRPLAYQWLNRLSSLFFMLSYAQR